MHVLGNEMGHEFIELVGKENYQGFVLRKYPSTFFITLFTEKITRATFREKEFRQY